MAIGNHLCGEPTVKDSPLRCPYYPRRFLASMQRLPLQGVST